MSAPTRTYNRIHFEDLDPHRFEDLVRQLLYDFRAWNKLEATGRGGGDDGFDARGWEIIAKDAEQIEIEAPEDIESDIESTSENRIWLIQCKREKSIASAKLIKYLQDISKSEVESLYGMLFVASCDFTKKTRDAFNAHCSTLGLQEFHLWGKSELEDLLYQPRFDHLLFAYFGISLQIRKRSITSELKRRLSLKRKAYRCLDKRTYHNILIRDPAAEHYPFTESEENPIRLWQVFNFEGFCHEGLVFHYKTHLAYLSDEGWDYAKVYNQSMLSNYEDPWVNEKVESQNDLTGHDVRNIWLEFPEANQALFKITGVIPFDDILDIDVHGDDWFESVHIYVDYEGRNIPFTRFMGSISVSGSSGYATISPKDPHDRRLTRFPKSMRE